MIEFRDGTPSDAFTIAELHTQSWRNTYRGILRDNYLDGDIFAERLALWETRLGNPESTQFSVIAFDEGRPVGFAFVLADADPQAGALLDNLHVLPEAQGTGLGKKILRRAGTWVRDQFPGQGIFLWVFEGNAPARRFYEKLGANIVERVIAEAPGGGRIAEWRYAWADANDLCHAIDLTIDKYRRRGNE